jgi:hypothetical protein
MWATMPDAELAALADAGKLRDPAVLAAQARRLLADPRSRALFDGFGSQWLGLDKLAGKTFDASKFPQMTPDLRASMLAKGDSSSSPSCARTGASRPSSTPTTSSSTRPWRRSTA